MKRFALPKFIFAITLLASLSAIAEVGSILSRPNQMVGAVRCGTGLDSVLVLLPSRGSGKILESETFQFTTKLLINGPSKPVETDVTGTITLRVHSFANRRVFVEGNLTFINPFLIDRQHQVEKLEQIQAQGAPTYAAFIYLNDRLRLTGELTSEEEVTRADNPVKLSSFGGKIFCAPVIESHGRTNAVKTIQGKQFQL